MRHWLTMLDRAPGDLRALVDRAAELKGGAQTDAIRGRILTMLFLNPSLRTRVSFEAAMLRYGGHAICLNVGGDVWGLEFEEGAVMNGKAAEHIREAAPVLSRYGDALAVRSFARLQDAEEDRRDIVLNGFAKHATVPVINMESAMEHPCQALADMMTMREQLGNCEGKRFVLTWAPQVNATPMAVPHSALLAAAGLGMQVTLAHPPGYELDARYAEYASVVTDNQRAACEGADVVYVKSWGSPRFYGSKEEQRDDFARHADWMVTRSLLGHAKLMHCLPVRRNVVIADDALDSPNSVVVDQAENRLWAQAAILEESFRCDKT